MSGMNSYYFGDNRALVSPPPPPPRHIWGGTAGNLEIFNDNRWRGVSFKILNGNTDFYCRFILYDENYEESS